MRHHTHIIIRILTVILLLTNVSGGGNLAYAWSGNGTSSDPYLIGSKADWDEFRNRLSANNSNKFNGEYLKLTADINIGGDITPTGSDFYGTFDGDGHTLKVNCSGTGRFIALFRGTYHATIKNLKVVGSIHNTATSSGYDHENKFTAGLVGNCQAGTVIQNCVISVTITSDISGDGSHGGIVGCVTNAAEKPIRIVNCLFNGKLLGPNTNNCGGFVGAGTNNNQKCEISHCLFSPSEITMKTYVIDVNNNINYTSATFSRCTNNTITTSYYTKAFGATQGTDASTDGADVIADNLNFSNPVSGNTWEVNEGGNVAYLSTFNKKVDITGWISGSTAGTSSSNPYLDIFGGNGVTYEYKDYTAGDGAYRTTAPTSAGHYYVRATDPFGFRNIKDFYVYDPPTPNKSLTYNGTDQYLLTVPTIDKGSYMFKIVDGAGWGASTPKGQAARTYTINYYIRSSDSNYKNIGTQESPIGSFEVTIAPKSLGSEAIVLGESTYIYDGTEKKPSVTVKDGNNVIPPSEYSVSYSGNKNVGTATVTVKDNENGNYTVNGSTTFSITKEQLVVTVTANDLYYNYEEQELVTGSIKGSGTYKPILYSLDNVTYTTDVPKGKKVKTYKVYYKIEGDDNHIGTDVAWVEASIKSKKVDNPKIEISPSVCTYDGKPKTPDVRVYDGTTEILSSEFTVSYSNNTNVGTATVTITDVEGGTYTVSGSATFTIKETGSSYTAPTVKTGLTYTGKAQELVTPGSTTTGTMHYYSLDGKSYSTDIPTGIDAKTYTVYYKVVGDDNHEDSPAVELSVTISSKDVTNPTITLSQSSYFYDGTAKKPSVTVKDGDTTIDSKEYTVSYSNNTNIGSATVTIKDKEGGNYIVSGKTTFFIIDPKSGFTPPSAISGLEYNGSAQKLIEAGSAPDDCKIVYSLDGKNYSAEIPTGTDAKTYTVYAKLVDKDNKDRPNTEVYTLTATINRKSVFISVTLTDAGPQKIPVITVTDLDGNKLGTNAFSVIFTNAEGQNVEPDKGKIAAGTYTVTVSLTGNFTGPSVAKGILILKDYSFAFTMESDLITICLPYDREKPAGYDIYRLNSIDNTGFPVFKRLNTTTLSAGQPYLFKYTGSSTRGSRTLDLSPSDSKSIDTSTKLESQTAGNLIFVGTFQDMSNEYATKNGSYILQTDGTWKVPEYANNKICLEAFHAYLHYRNRSVHVSPMTMTLTDSGKVDPEPEPAAIDGVILEEEDGSRAWYDLQGRRLDGPQKGVNILRTKDGKTKKVVKK